MALGFHVSKSGRSMDSALAEELQTMKDLGFTKIAAQIFVTGPQSYKETLSEAEKKGIAKIIQDTGAKIVIHGAYVDHPWTLSRGSVPNIIKELRINSEIGGAGVIVHLGKGAADKDIFAQVLREIRNGTSMLPNAMLWLEVHTAKSSEYTYETPQKIAKLAKRMADFASDMKLGLCIDTAHLYSCGMDLGTYAAASKWLAALPELPLMIHLNDSASSLGSGVDRHQTLLQGNIWGKYGRNGMPLENSGLLAVLEYAERNDITVILERAAGGIRSDLELIRKLNYFCN